MVKPYDFVYNTYAKQRWLGKTILEIFAKEFKDKSVAYYKHAIDRGQITVNGNAVSIDYVCKNSDLIENLVHRHEPPICNSEIQIISQSEDILVVNKPGGIPVHPVGRYNFNSLIQILKFEMGFEELHCVNRIDRLTSGLVILARNPQKAAEMMLTMKERAIKKIYYARVRGKFPFDVIECKEPIETISHKVGINIVSEKGKPCFTKFTFLHYNGITSLVKCEPMTGRTHQIRVHLQYLGYPIANDPVYGCSEWSSKNYKPYGDPTEIKEIVDSVTDKVFAAEPPFDENSSGCFECKIQRKDPIPEQLYIWLHAYSYEGPGWKYNTSDPDWAENTWKGDQTLEERFWKYGGLWDGVAPGKYI
jgi:RluA family pseudouridine synthase